jgi:hypothetical protein
MGIIVLKILLGLNNFPMIKNVILPVEEGVLEQILLNYQNQLPLKDLIMV